MVVLVQRIGNELVFLYPVVDDSAVHVITAQVGIAVGCQYFKYTLVYAQDGDIKCTTTQVVYRYRFFFGRIYPYTVSQGCSRWFVHDAQHFQPGQFAGIAGCLAL